MNIYIKMLFILLIFFMAAGIPASADSGEPRMVPHSVAGVIDIREMAGEQGEQKVSLEGEWEFYWKQLLEPEDWKRGQPQGAYFQVPSSWKAELFGEADHNNYGYGTYRLLMRIPASDIGGSKALFLRPIGSAYRIWIDGQEESGFGTVGASRDVERPQSHINLLFFQPKQQTVELIIQASNFSFREGGITGEIVYGDTGALIPLILKELLYDIFIIGGFLMIGLYHFIIYAMGRRDLSTLFVGMTALAISARTLFINGYLSSLLLDIHHWELLVKLEYTAELAGFLSIVLLMKYLYPEEVHRSMIGLTVLLSAGLFLFILVTPARIYTESMMMQSALKGAILLYFVVIVGIRALIRKRKGALIHLTALLIIVAAIINDTLYFVRALKTVELLDYSIVPFVMAQAVIVSYRYSQLSRRNDRLVKELESMNATLELKVEARTRGLQDANRQLSETKELRSKMLANIAHDLGSPFAGVQSHLELMAAGKLSAQRTDIVKRLLDKTAFIQRLIYDLFELSKLESQEMKFHIENVAANRWIQEMFDKFSDDLRQEGFALQLGRIETACASGEAYVRIDRFRMLQTLHNLMGNAVKFSREMSSTITINGYVRLKEDGSCNEFVVEVADSGIGMTEAEQQLVFRRLYMKREGNETGSGLGLAIVKEIVERHQGEVGVRTRQGKGSVFYFTLPVINGRDPELGE